ncbi:hypothetical protein GGI35DRAFT_332297 [Trichoderma velutinum]
MKPSSFSSYLYECAISGSHLLQPGSNNRTKSQASLFPFSHRRIALFCVFFHSRCRSVAPTWRRDFNSLGHRVLTDPASTSTTKYFHFCFLLCTTYLFTGSVLSSSNLYPGPGVQVQSTSHTQGRIAPGTPLCSEDIATTPGQHLLQTNRSCDAAYKVVVRGKGKSQPLSSYSPCAALGETRPKVG